VAAPGRAVSRRAERRALRVPSGAAALSPQRREGDQAERAAALRLLPADLGLAVRERLVDALWWLLALLADAVSVFGDLVDGLRR
jgi:hypothetical protein